MITQRMIQVFRQKIFHVVPSFDHNTNLIIIYHTRLLENLFTDKAEN